MHASPRIAHGFPVYARWSEIAARASRLDERLGPLYRSDDHHEASAKALIAERLAQWERALNREGASHEHAALAKRLSWDGLALETMAAALGPVVLADRETPPAWLDFLVEVTTAAGEGEDRETSPVERAFAPPGEAENTIPFFALWHPFLVVARRRLAALAGLTLHWLTPDAAAGLAADLIRQLALQGAPAAQERFASFRTSHLSASAPTAPNGISTGVYDGFVASTRRDGMGDFFSEYSALARQLCLRTQQWVTNTTCLLARLEADQAEIQNVFLEGQPPGSIRAVRAGLSDRHHGGQQVTALEFQSGLRLIYKPKSLAQEAAFQNLLGWLADTAAPEHHGEELSLPPPMRLLPREGGYGWVECVEPSACEDRAGVERYYRRAGGLLCLLHALGGNDCHRENVFATRAGPVLVDIESLLQPAWDPTNPEAGAAVPAPASVLQTGLLPLWKRGSDGEFTDVSGLGGQGNRRTRLRRRVWRGINTDGMHLAEEPVVTITTPNIPTLDGEAQLPQDHAGALLAGFEQCYRFLLVHREKIAAPDGPLQALGKADSRLICRASNLYGKLLRALAENPRYSRDGFERSVAIEALTRPLLAAPRKPGLWALLATERLAVEEGDVPFFTVAQVAGTLGIAPGLFAPDFAAALRRLGEDDLARQTEIVRASLLRTAESELLQPLARAVAAIPTDLPSLTDAQMLAEARRLAVEIVARAEINEHGASWLSPEALRPGVDGARGAPLYFYGGAPGIAFFLAALDRVTGDRQHRELIEASCRPIHAFLDSPTFPQWVGREPLGAALGLGSVVYALSRIGEFLGEPAYLETAARTARWILPERVLADTSYDVLSGSAGAILGLLTFHGITGESFALDLAVQCGRHLCANARPTPGHGVAWPTGQRGALLAGFAHGAAGIGYALARLHAATGGDEPSFLQTARAAVAYEQSVYAEKAGNWPVVASPDDPPREPLFLSTWCHGAPGIGLGRIGGLAALDDAPVRRDIALALKNVVNGGLSNIDHLCCGNLGRIEVAWTAAHALQRPELGAVARAAASHVVAQAARADGAYRLRTDAVENRFFEAGFFRGVSGIGYSLLRLIQPQLPCPLLFA